MSQTQNASNAISTFVELGRRIATDAGAQALDLGRDVYDKARGGENVSELAGTVVEGWLHMLRSSVHHANELSVPGADRLEGLAAQAEEMARPLMDSVVPQRVNEFVESRSAKDIRTQLRKKGRELLDRSTQLDDPDEHPAFSRIINEMSPDEARVLRLLAEKGPQPVVDVVKVDPIGGGNHEVAHHANWVGLEAGCIRPEYGHLYIDNLVRLGLAHLRDYRVADEQAYELMYAQPEIDELPPPKGFMVKHAIKDRGVEISQFGQEMYDICFSEDESVLDEANDVEQSVQEAMQE